MPPHTELPADDRALLPRWALGLGGVLAILGLLAIAAPWAASAVIDYVCAGTLIAAGLWLRRSVG